MANKKQKKSTRRQTAFLEALAMGLSIREAAETVGVGLRTVYTWRSEDADFAAGWELAYEQGADALFVEARRRAVDGTSEPVYYKGELVGTIQKYSDPLLMFLMKSRDPALYCDRIRAAKIERQWNKDDGSGIPDVDALARLAEMLAQLAHAKAQMVDPDEDEASIH